MPFIGVQPSRGLGDVQVSTFSGNASTTAFTLPVAATTNGAAVHISGVRQVPTTDFAISSTTLTFTTAPPTGSSNIMVAYTKPATLSVPADDSVTSAKIGDDQIDSEHYAAGSIDTAHIAANQIDGTLTKDALIADFSDVTITASDLIWYGDATDSNNSKRDTVQGILDLVSAGFTLGTEQATTSGTSVTFGRIPTGTKFIAILFEGVSWTGAVVPTITIGDSGGLETSGYDATGVRTDQTTQTRSTAAFTWDTVDAVGTLQGTMFLNLKDASNFTWIASLSGYQGTTGYGFCGGGSKSLSAELTQLSIGGGTFDAGSINIMYM